MEYWNKYKYTVINSHRKTAENDFNHIGGFLLFFLVYVILEAFAGLERRRVARGDFDFFARLRVSAIIATNSDLFIVTPPRSYMVILYTITDFIFWQYILMIFVVLKEK